MQCVRRDRRADPILAAVAFASSYVICLLHFMPCTAPIPCHAGRTTFVSCGINVDNVAGQEFVTLLEHACRFGVSSLPRDTQPSSQLAPRHYHVYM